MSDRISLPPSPSPVSRRSADYPLSSCRYVWLVPRYTPVRPAAVAGFELVIQEPRAADEALQDLAKGAGGEYRYLLPVKDVTKEAKVTEVALLRINEHLPLGQPPEGWSGVTGDINRHRGGTYLYLLWKSAV